MGDGHGHEEERGNQRQDRHYHVELGKSGELVQAHDDDDDDDDVGYDWRRHVRVEC